MSRVNLEEELSIGNKFKRELILPRLQVQLLSLAYQGMTIEGDNVSQLH